MAVTSNYNSFKVLKSDLKSIIFNMHLTKRQVRNTATTPIPPNLNLLFPKIANKINSPTKGKHGTCGINP